MKGFNNWKKGREKFSSHADSGTHKEALLKIQMLNQERIHSSLHKQAQADQKLHWNLLIKQLSSLQFLAKQGLAIRRNDEMEGNLLQLLELRSEDCPELKKWLSERKYFSPEF